MSHRSRFQIPDYPADRPRVPEVRRLITAYREKPGNLAGGNCHVVLDDGNISPSHLEFCISDCRGAGDEDGESIIRLMLRMTPSQRRRVIGGGT